MLHYAPVVGGAPKRKVSQRFLCEDERVRLADMRRAGQGVRAIAQALDRSPSTVSRELRRNVEAAGSAYRPHAAQRLAEQRRARPRVGKLVADVELRAFVEDKLKRRWSPEQIAQALRVEFPDQPHRHLVPETIYQALYRPQLGGGLCRNLPRVLRTGRSRRKRRRRAGQRRGRLVNMTMIDQRPGEAADREVAGHWEGDLITGESNRSASARWWSGRAGTRSCCTSPAGTPPKRCATPSSMR